MQIYIVFVVVMVAGFIFVGEYLARWAPEYSPPQIVQIKIIMNVIRSAISVLLFMGFPLFKFRYSFHGILIDKNLFEEASLGTNDTKIDSRSKDKSDSDGPGRTNEQHLADIVNLGQKSNSSSYSNKRLSLRNSRTSVKLKRIGNKMYPTLLSFLSRNKKCYEEFKAHLIDCLAVENLLFFAQGTFSLIAMYNYLHVISYINST